MTPMTEDQHATVKSMTVTVVVVAAAVAVTVTAAVTTTVLAVAAVLAVVTLWCLRFYRRLPDRCRRMGKLIQRRQPPAPVRRGEMRVPSP
jgi:heme O synthase-like polyprenyltransferase